MNKKIYLLLCLFLFSCNNEGGDNNINNILGIDLHVESNHNREVIIPTIVEWRDNHKQVVSFTWDDTTPGHKSVAKILDKHNIKGTFFIVTNSYLNWKNRVVTAIKRRTTLNYTGIYMNGHEIGSHTAHHCNMIHASLDSVDYECRLSSEQIHGLFGFYPATLSHPTSHYNHAIDSVIHKYYLDSRYSTEKDFDTTIVFMHVRTAYDFNYYKSSIDSFAASEKKQYIYGGHELDGLGYEPISSGTLDSLLTYMTQKYATSFWITTFGNLTMYKYLHDNIILDNTPGETIISLRGGDAVLSKYTQPEAIITLCFPNVNLDFASEGLVNYWYADGNSYVNVDLRKSCKVKYW